MLVMISSMSVSISNHVHVRRANSSRITPFKRVPVFLPSFVGTPSIQWHKILSQITTDSKLSYGENPKSISSGLRSVPGRDRQQDRITIANIYIQLYSSFNDSKKTKTNNNKQETETRLNINSHINHIKSFRSRLAQPKTELHTELSIFINFVKNFCLRHTIKLDTDWL